MAEYLIQSETLTGIADKIRVLNDTTGNMSPAEMQGELDTFNTELGETVTEQDNLIAQIMGALEGKCVPEAKKTVSVTLSTDTKSAIYYFDGSGNLISVPYNTSNLVAEVFGGIMYTNGSYNEVSGDYVGGAVGGSYLYKFNADGGSLYACDEK